MLNDERTAGLQDGSEQINLKPSTGTENEALDLPPELCHYRDEGCEMAASCLHCPFPECLDDMRGGRTKWARSIRDREIFLMRCRDKISVDDLMRRFRLSRRAVYRSLQAGSEAVTIEKYFSEKGLKAKDAKRSYNPDRRKRS